MTKPFGALMMHQYLESSQEKILLFWLPLQGFPTGCNKFNLELN